jgi:hypothetical protein
VVSQAWRDAAWACLEQGTALKTYYHFARKCKVKSVIPLYRECCQDSVTTSRKKKKEIRKSALHGKGWGYEKLFAPAEQMRKQPGLISKFAGLVAIHENAKRQQLDDVQKAIAAMGNRLAARQKKDISANAAKSGLPLAAPVVSSKRDNDAESER